eukprot:scaffold192813_cov26-Tisochrysis_lutea.AAC.1
MLAKQSLSLMQVSCCLPSQQDFVQACTMLRKAEQGTLKKQSTHTAEKPLMLTWQNFSVICIARVLNMSLEACWLVILRRPQSVIIHG